MFCEWECQGLSPSSVIQKSIKEGIKYCKVFKNIHSYSVDSNGNELALWQKIFSHFKVYPVKQKLSFQPTQSIVLTSLEGFSSRIPRPETTWVKIFDGHILRWRIWIGKKRYIAVGWLKLPINIVKYVSEKNSRRLP